MKVALIGLAFIVVILLIAVIGSWLATKQDPLHLDHDADEVPRK